MVTWQKHLKQNGCLVDELLPTAEAKLYKDESSET